MQALCVSKPSGSEGEWHARGARKIAGQGLKEKTYMPPRMKLLSFSANETSLTSLHLMKLRGTDHSAPAFKPANYTPAAPPQIYSPTEQPMQLVPNLGGTLKLSTNPRLLTLEGAKRDIQQLPGWKTQEGALHSSVALAAYQAEGHRRTWLTFVQASRRNFVRGRFMIFEPVSQRSLPTLYLQPPHRLLQLTDKEAVEASTKYVKVNSDCLLDRVVEQGVRVVPDLTSPTQLEAVFAGLLLLQGVGNILLSVVKQFELDTPKSLLITFRPVLL